VKLRFVLVPALLAALCGTTASRLALAQPPDPGAQADEGYVSLDFDNAELADVIDLIAKLTNKNFIYDDRVRGRVTIVSPTRVSIEQAYAVFESVLQVKGFTTVESPGGAVKVIPLREAKETNVETVYGGAALNRDRFITRLIPLQYIEADPIVNTLKPLVSKDAAIAAYGPTNTVILTESASNIRRIIGILQSIDVESYRPSLAVIKVEHADAATLAEQIAEIYGAETSSASTGQGLRARRPVQPRAPGVQPDAATGLGGIQGSRVRIITDERTNSLIVLSPRTQLEDVRGLVRKLDVPVEGGGSIHVYYLRNADAEELAATLSSLLSGQPRASKTGVAGAAPGAAPGSQVQSLRAAVTELAEGISVTADPPTNSLVIQASKEGFNALKDVIAQLDVERPQVLVEALIMEVDVSDNSALGFNGIVRFMGGSGNDPPKAAGSAGFSTDSNSAAQPTAPDETTGSLFPAAAAAGAAAAGTPFLSRFAYDFANQNGKGFQIESILRAAASDSGTNILSAPHILTSDNEQAEIRVGDNIPIISQRLNNAVGNANNLAQSVSVERQDIGVTLRVTPQITEGDTLRLEIFQEITDVNAGLQGSVGNQEEVGVALSNRRIENTVVVQDGETVVIGGLLKNSDQDSVSKVPFLGDIPVLGWLFKTTTDSVIKTNLLVFLTPHIIRSPRDLEGRTIEKREEFLDHSHDAQNISDAELEAERERRQQARDAGEHYRARNVENPVRMALLDHELRYPLARMQQIEQEARDARSRADSAGAAGARYTLQAGIFGDEQAAANALTELIDAGFDGSLVTTDVDGTALYEVRVGPFGSRAAAERAAEVLRSAHQLSPRVVVEEPEAGAGAGEAPGSAEDASRE